MKLPMPCSPRWPRRRRTERLCCSWPSPTADDSVVSPALLAAAKSGPKEVRISAIGVVGRLGDASSLSPLLEIATDADAELVQAAEDSAGQSAG